MSNGQADAAKAIERTGTLELENAKQRERTAKAETELLVLQESLKPRRLTLPQRTRLINDLFKGERGEIVIHFASGDAEAEHFATDIAEVLHVSGWTVSSLNSSVFLGGPTPIGLHMTVQDPQAPRVPALLSAFEHIGISVPVTINPKANPSVQLTVGTKP